MARVFIIPEISRLACGMGKAEPVYPVGLEPWSLHRVFRTVTTGWESNQVQRAHRHVMGTLRYVHSPRPSRFGNRCGMTGALESSLPGACFAHLLNIDTPWLPAMESGDGSKT